MNYKTTHPVLIFEGIYKLIFLLLIPLVRGFAATLDGGFYRWIRGAWADVAVLFVILTAAVLRWWLTLYAFDGRSISLRGGLFLYTDKRIPLEKLTSVNFEEPWYYRPFSAVRVRFDTLAKSGRRADISLVLSKGEAKRIFTALCRERKESRKISSPNLKNVIIISAFVSNFVAGAGLVLAFFARVGTLLEKDFAGELKQIFLLDSRRIVTVAALITAVGWVTAFCINLVRYTHLTISKDEDTLIIRGGAFTRRTVLVRRDKIDFINMQQGLFTRLFGLCTVFCHTAGVGKKKGDLTALTPAGENVETDSNIKELFPEFARSKIIVKPPKKSLLRFVADPLWLLVPTLTVAAVAGVLHFKILLTLAFFVSIPATWWLLVRIVDLITSGMGGCEDSLTLSYSTLFKLNTVIIPRKKIAAVKFRQSPFQRLDKRCDIFVYSKGENPRRHRIRNVDGKTAKKLLRMKKDG